jgi:serine/threonine protein kinase
VVQRFPTWWIKIGDFGIAKQNTNTSLKTKIGSPSYQAPEVSGYIDTDTDEYTNLCDVWSLGCVIYWLLTEEVPFPATKPKRLMDFVEDCNTFPAHILHEKRVSASGIDFVKRMIVARPEERPSTNVVLEHPWVKEVESIPRHSSDQHPPLPVRQK